MAEKKGAKEDEKLITRAKKCLEDFEDREDDNIKRAKEAVLFRSGEQWPSIIRRDRENEHQDGGSRPCPVMDKTNQYVRQVINEERQNRAAIKIRPVDDGADPKIAEVYTGLIRHIEDASEAIVAYTTGGEHAIDGGFGYWRILAEYTDPMSFNQDIRIKRIHNRFSVALGYHTEADGADMTEAVIWEDVPRDQFTSEYPKAKEVPFDGSGDANWAAKDTIRVAEYYCIKPRPETIYLLDDGKTYTKDQYEEIVEKAAAMGMAPGVIDTRETQINQIKWYKITNAEILDQADIPGTYIPIVKVTGNEITMPDGKIKVWGMIDEMMDPQRLHNFATAGFIEQVALAPRAPWIAEARQVENYEQDYKNANRLPIAVLKYDAVTDDGAILPSPKRVQPSGMDAGWQAMLGNTEHGIEAAAGMYGPSVGAMSQERSGIALQEQKAQGATGNFHFPDNLSRSIQHTGRILLEWIPVYYDTKRIARILGEDGQEETVQLDPNQEQPVEPILDNMGQETGQSYNLNVGRYDVTVSTGPSYASKRQEAADSMVQVVTSKPELMQVIGDLVFENMDWPGAEQISKRLKTLLPPEIQKMEQADAKNMDPKLVVAMQKIEQTAMQLEERGQALIKFEQELKNEAAKTDGDTAKLQAQEQEARAQRQIFEANVKTAKANLELMGEKLINQLVGITDPIAQKMDQITQEVEVESEEGEEPETVVIQDPAMQEALILLSQANQEAIQQVSQVTMDAMEKITQAVTAPRETEIQFNEEGDPIGSVSRVG